MTIEDDDLAGIHRGIEDDGPGPRVLTQVALVLVLTLIAGGAYVACGWI